MLKSVFVAFSLFLAAFALSPPAFAQRNSPLFEDQTPIDIVIEAQIAELVRRAPHSTDPSPAVMTIAGSDQRYDIQIEPRGVSRRTLGICSFPPIRLDLPRGAMRGSVFEGQNRLKLVTRCRSGGQFEQIVAREYLAYRLYNLMTPQSHRVRPVRVTFRETGRGGRDQVHMGFVIEDVDDVARRAGLVEVDLMTGDVNSQALNPAAATRYALFQYMIGNLDWDMVSGRPGEECCHNSRMLGAAATARTGLIPTPYDFDYSGLVGAPYAVPPEQLAPVRDVRVRVYRGYCRYNDQVPAAIGEFVSRREAVMAAIATEGWLSDGSRRVAQRYIEGFYELIQDQGRVERQIIQRCR